MKISKNGNKCTPACHLITLYSPVRWVAQCPFEGSHLINAKRKEQQQQKESEEEDRGAIT